MRRLGINRFFKLPRWNSFRRWSLKKRLFFVLVTVVSLYVFLCHLRVIEFLGYGASYLKIIIYLVQQDNRHYYDIMTQEAQTVWNLHIFQKKYMGQWCQDVPERKNVTWLITLNNDELAVGAVAVGYILQRFSCHLKLTALVTEALSKETRLILEKILAEYLSSIKKDFLIYADIEGFVNPSVLTGPDDRPDMIVINNSKDKDTCVKMVGYDVLLVEGLDCNWMAKIKGRSGSSTGIPGTHTRFHAWKLEQYDKIIYVDTDFLPLVNMDELFDIPEEFSAVYHRQPGIFDTCFNAGILVFRPSKRVYDELINIWKDMTDVMGCPHDQRVLWYYFAFSGRWNPIPYSYNVWRLSYYPLRGIWSPLVHAYKLHDSLFYPMKAYHFAGFGIIRKPWEVKKRPTRREAARFTGPLLKPNDMISLWWQLFYEALEEFDLDDWWKTTKVYQST